MSYEELGAHATEIVRKAKEWELTRLGYTDMGDGTWMPPAGYSYADTQPTNYGDPGGTATQTTSSQDMVDRDMAEIDGKYDDIPELFSPFTWLPDPTSFDGAITGMENVQARLSAGAEDTTDPASGSPVPANLVLDGMDTSSDYLARWTGVAAMAFKQNFVDTFESITTNQFLAASYVKGALEAEKSLWHAARANVDQIAEDTLTALEHMDDCGKNEWSMAFTVAGAVVAIAAIPFTGGASTLAFTAVGGALSIGGAAIGNTDDPPELPMAGESPEAVCDAMREALRELKSEISKAEQKVYDSMVDLNNILAVNRSLFVAPRPDLADSGPGDIRDDMGVPR